MVLRNRGKFVIIGVLLFSVVITAIQVLGADIWITRIPITLTDVTHVIDFLNVTDTFYLSDPGMATCDLKTYANGTVYCGTDATGNGTGGSGVSMWVDQGTYLQPNTSYADNIFVDGYVYATDWTNVSITESQISDLAHTTNCSVTDSCANIQYGTEQVNTTEEIQDASGEMDDGTETRITVTYNDATNEIDYVVDDMNDDNPDNDGEVPDDLTITSTKNITTNKFVLLSQSQRVCLDGATCSKYIVYNGSHVLVQG